MSQITRCPSCATMFKVVADQLRISDGWVRCGQCKEVFDASAHLLPSEPQVLLPDVCMAAAPPPPAPARRATDDVQVWGAYADWGQTAATAPGVPPVGAQDLPEGPVASDAMLDVPVPAVSALLVADAETVFSPEMRPALQPGGTLAWRSVGSTGDTFLEPAVDDRAPAIPAGAGESRKEETPAIRINECPAGYELPTAELGDPDVADGLPDGIPAAGALYAPLELLRKPSDEAPSPTGFGGEGESEPAQEDEPERASSQPLEAPFPPEVLLRPDRGQSEALEVAAPDGMPLAQQEYDPPEDSVGAEDVSFVRAAKRKAFWRRPLVRVVLGTIGVVLLCTLALQVVLQERDRIAAMDPRVRPWLQALCEPFQCTLAPLKQMSDVVIDSSSFNKGRGDSYQLTFAIKNRANIPLAMPAMELTLTDAQDQPVLRRVFLPPEMAAPAELPALGVWNSSVAVIVTTGGARVAGYRLLAFYP
ncbi:DUF3426 domain-containing protein [Acidovorax soli]|nr:DUF3426 domain-containing protein [Acidovorax soli]